MVESGDGIGIQPGQLTKVGTGTVYPIPQDVYKRQGSSIMAGPFFVCGDSGESFRSLTDEEVTKYMARFAQPEDISPEEVEADMGFMIYPM